MRTFLKRKSAYGPTGLFIAALGVLVVGFTAWMAMIFALISLQQAAFGFDTEPAMAALQTVLNIWIPLAALGGITAVAAGLLLHADREVGRRLAQATCLYSLAWSVGYFFALGPYMEEFVREVGDAGFSTFTPFIGVVALVARLSIFSVAPAPALALLWALRKRKA